MKRCPTCNKTFSDPVLSFCVDDGTPLVADDETTVVSPGANEDWNAVAYRPPGSYSAPGGPGGRRVWPWILGIVGALVLAVAGLGIAAAVFVPRLVRSEQNKQVNARTDGPSSTNVNQSTENIANSNSNSSETITTPPPTDKELVLSQLTQLENEWTVANLNADKKALDRILADDYTGSAANGRLQGKAEYIRTIKPDSTVEKWNFENLQVTLRGDRASLSGKIRLIIQGKEEALDFTDTFAWRNGRWQATSSEVKRSQ